MHRQEAGGWMCATCGWETKLRTRLWEHVESAHVATSGYTCELCNKFCPNKNSYKVHKSRRCPAKNVLNI